jgi:hypothetical protein
MQSFDFSHVFSPSLDKIDGWDHARARCALPGYACLPLHAAEGAGDDGMPARGCIGTAGLIRPLYYLSVTNQVKWGKYFLNFYPLNTYRSQSG